MTGVRAREAKEAGERDAPGPDLRTVPGRTPWRVRAGELDLTRPRVVGIVNLTPDSFSDGGDLPTLEAALERAARHVAEGAALLDVGGESTRPGAAPVPPDREAERILPFVEAAAARFDVPLSVDTRNASVARRALEAGARVVNDVSGLSFDPDMGAVVAGSGAGLVLMHMRGEPATMGERARYRDVVAEVAAELGEAVERGRRAGVADESVVLDPGLGFAKTGEHNLELLARLPELLDAGFPLLVGPSRKRFLGELLGVPPKERLHGTVAACVAAYLAGARLFRVHDVGPVVQALRVAEAIRAAGGDR